MIPSGWAVPPVSGGYCGVLNVSVITREIGYPHEIVHLKKIKVVQKWEEKGHRINMLGVNPWSNGQKSSFKKHTYTREEQYNRDDDSVRKGGTCRTPLHASLAHEGILFETRVLSE